MSFSKSKFLLVLAILCISTFADQVFAATITVNSTADNGPGDCNTTCTLRDAVAVSSEGDSIVFTGLEGIITLAGGAIEINHNLTITGPGEDLLTIDGDNQYTILNITTGDVNISELTFINAVNSVNNGGAINNSGDGILTISNSTFNNNDCGFGYGGAIYGGNASDLIVTNSTFTNNSCVTDGGGAIYFEGGSLTVSSSTFTDNDAGLYDYEGGAIYSGGTTIISDSTFTNNTAFQGAALYQNSGDLTISDSTFTGNESGNLGGGIAFSTAGDLTISGSTFSNNQNEGEGGAIYFSGNNLDIADTTFSGNDSNSYDGSAIWLNAIEANIVRSTFTGNLDGYGVIYNSGNTPTITNSTFANNDSSQEDYSAGFQGGANIVNSIFYNNLGGGGQPLFSGGSDYTIVNSIFYGNIGGCYETSVTSLGHNIDSGTSCGFDAEGDLSSTDPLFDPLGLQDNGGLVQTIALLTGSPAINAGDDESAPNTDARGFARSGISDIGAYEYIPVSDDDNEPASTRRARNDRGMSLGTAVSFSSENEIRLITDQVIQLMTKLIELLSDNLVQLQIGD